jgi:hypothetical protein
MSGAGRDVRWLLAAAAGFWFVRIWQSSGERIGAFVNADVLTYWLPLLREAAAQWRDWSVPLWSPYQAFGTPLLATQQVAALYPLNALYLVLGLGWAWLLTALLHHVIAGTGMLALCRRLGMMPEAALIGALSYAFSAVVIEKYVDLPDEFICLVWLPALLACADAVVAGATRATVGRLAAVWALQILGGDAETITRSALLVCGYVAVRSIDEWSRGSRRGAASALAVAGAGALAAGLTAVQWLPTLELLRHSVRAVGTLTAAQQGVLAADPWLLFMSLPGRAPVLTIGSSLPLVLALVGWWTWPRRAMAWGFTLLAVVLAVLSAGPATPLFDWVRALPTGTWFRAPLRFLNFWPLCLAILSAAAVDQLCRKVRILRPLGCAVLVAVVVKCALAWRTGTPLAWATTAFADLLPLLLLLAAVAWSDRLSDDRARRVRARWATAGAGALIVAAPIALYLPGYLSPHRVADLYDRHAALFARLRRESPARTLSLLRFLPDDEDGRRSWAKLGTYFRTPVLNDFEPLSLVDFERFAVGLRASAPPVSMEEVLIPFMGQLTPPRPHFSQRLLNLSGTRFVVVDAERAALIREWFDATLTEWWRSNAAIVYENRAALPRALWVPTSGARVGGPRCREALQEPGFDPTRHVLLDEVPVKLESAAQSGSGEVRISQYAPAEVRIELRSEHAGYAVLTDAFYPGWVASLDGQEVPIIRADCFFRAVAVPRGTHEIRMHYRPRSVALGGAISLAAGALVVGLWVSSLPTYRRG